MLEFFPTHTFLTALFVSFVTLSTRSALAESKAPPAREPGVSLRFGAAATPLVSAIRYKGPANGFNPDEPQPPQEDLELSSSALSLGGGLWTSIGYRDGSSNRFALEASLVLGAVVMGGSELPYTEVELLALASIGPSYTRSLSPRFDLDVALRAARFTFAGARADIGAYDNVIEFAPQYGFLARLGGAYRLTPWGHTALAWGIEGGPQFGGYQSSYVGLAQVGISWD